MRTTVCRIAAVAAPMLTVSLLASAQPSYAADPTPSGTSAATWTRGQLTNGTFVGAFGPDYGLSIDAARSFAALGDTTGLAAVNAAISSHLTDYSDYDYVITDPPAPGHYAGRASGAVAKELVLAQLAGANPRSYGSPATDLVARLEAMVGADGRTADVATKDGAPDPSGDFANTIGQSFAVQGLNAASSPKAAVATDFLLKQQCPGGFFRLSFADKAAADQGCHVNSSPDTDVTAFAVVALQSQRTQPAVSAALDKAIAWLLATQAANGSFGGGDLTEAPNTNSTGLVAWALGASCRVDAAVKAAAYVRSFQVPAGQTGPLGSEVGAIAYDNNARTLGQSQGITDATRDQWRRATAQAAPGLAWDPSATATVQISAPKRFVKAGASAKITITGAAAGELVCVTEPSGPRAVTGTGGPLTIDVKTPKKGDAVVSATTGPGADSATIPTLAKERLKPKLAATVGQGDKPVVRVKSLGAKEKVKVYVDGKLVGKGRATKKGVFAGRFVARLKVGSHTLKVVGQFKNRSGTATFRVVR